MTGGSEDGTIEIIGIDCAVDPKRIGVAAAELTAGGLRNLELLAPLASEEILAWVAARARGERPLLFALDSPLGWPAALGNTLHAHVAGEPVEAEPNELFRRLTDRVVRQRIGKQPLEVGADRIARTAVAALGLLARLGSASSRKIPLAWEPGAPSSAAAIETYPAAWLISRGLPADRYKYSGPEALDRREQIVWNISPQFEGGIRPAARSQIVSSSHLLDAVICVLCGADFLLGRCLPPDTSERETARKEGWIWFPDAAGTEG